MSLIEIQVETETVDVGGGISVTLAPLTMSDIVGLLRDRGSFIGETIAEFAPVLSSQDSATALAFSSRLLTQAPPLVAAVIAHSAGEPEAVTHAASLPLAMQAKLFAVALRLTLANNEPATLFSELVAAVAPMRPLLMPNLH